MEKLRKFGKNKTLYYLEVDKIFNVEDRTIEETEFIEKCLEDMGIDLESEETEDFILSAGHLIYLLTGIVREWDTFKEMSSPKFWTSHKHKSNTKMEKTEYDDLNYLKLKDILTTDEILMSLDIDEPKKMKFIRDYLNDRLQVNIEKNDIIVIEPICTSLLILLIYDIVNSFVTGLNSREIGRHTS